MWRPESAQPEGEAGQLPGGGPDLTGAPVGAGRAWGRHALWASLLVILLATLSPGSWSQTEGRPQGVDGRLADILLNLALFAPFGAALGYRGRSAPQALVVGTLLSGAVELAQLWIPARVSGVSDVLVDAIGTLVGWAVWRTSPVWASPDPRAARRLVMAAALGAGAVVGATGLLLEPAFPPFPYFGHWTPEFGRQPVYRGHVIAASVGSASIPSGLIPHFLELRGQLLAGEPLRVRGTAGPHGVGLAPILSLNDYQRELLLLGADGDDLVYRFRTRGMSLGLDSPELRVPGALGAVAAGDPLAVVVKPDRNGYCIELNGAATCGVGFTAGMGWALLVYGQGIPRAIDGFLSVLWMAGLAFPVGYYLRSGWPSGLALVLLFGGVVVLPAAAGLVPTPAQELAGVLAGLLVGVWLQRRRLAPRNSPSRRGREH